RREAVLSDVRSPCPRIADLELLQREDRTDLGARALDREVVRDAAHVGAIGQRDEAVIVARLCVGVSSYDDRNLCCATGRDCVRPGEVDERARGRRLTLQAE